MNTAEIKAGTVLVSNHQTGPVFCQVVDFVKAVKIWEQDHVLAVKNGEFIQVHSIGSEDMLGIGWKLATAREIETMNKDRAAN